MGQFGCGVLFVGTIVMVGVALGGGSRWTFFAFWAAFHFANLAFTARGWRKMLEKRGLEASSSFRIFEVKASGLGSDREVEIRSWGFARLLRFRLTRIAIRSAALPPLELGGETLMTRLTGEDVQTGDASFDKRVLIGDLDRPRETGRSSDTKPHPGRRRGPADARRRRGGRRPEPVRRGRLRLVGGGARAR